MEPYGPSSEQFLSECRTGQSGERQDGMCFSRGRARMVWGTFVLIHGK